MDWLVDRVFPFRRLTVWLGLLVLAVALITVALAAVLVLPSLRGDLVDDRVASVARSAEQSAPTFASNFADALAGAGGSADANAVTAAYGALTDTQAYVFQRIDAGRLVPVTEPIAPGASPAAARAAVDAGIQRGTARVGREEVAEAAYAMRIGDAVYVVLLQSSLADVDAAVRLTVRRSLVGALIALPLAVLIGALAAALLTRRLRRLERASSRIAAGTLDAPIEDRGRDEIGDLAQALDRMRDELAATDAARRAFVANASHELRTPVFALSGFMELLVDEEDTDRRDQYLATMADQVGRLTRLATDLLDLSRLDSGKVPLDIEPVELSAVAARVAADLAAVATARGAIVDVAAEPAMALGDETRIGQIARALVDNAVRHNPAGVRVRIATRTGGGIASLVVEDSGPRIPDAEARAVFGRFARGTGAGEGSGLGLAIASELAERMGGRLVLDQTGERKAFRLDLAEDAGSHPPVSA
ncbi:MAG: sensor histidine kinase [Actinomycetota bacterium]